jgi:hypothetical protein
MGRVEAGVGDYNKGTEWRKRTERDSIVWESKKGKGYEEIREKER